MAMAQPPFNRPLAGWAAAAGAAATAQPLADAASAAMPPQAPRCSG